MVKCKCGHDKDMHANTFAGECLGDCFGSADKDNLIKCGCKKFKKR